ncbi:hypothetical protein BD779DRAFT_206231 [Infundibulicybe gibba]|nr:hypothetical protein BD779DRAFT_206231 [Infundibulicybe gibba]
MRRAGCRARTHTRAGRRSGRLRGGRNELFGEQVLLLLCAALDGLESCCAFEWGCTRDGRGGSRDGRAGNNVVALAHEHAWRTGSGKRGRLKGADSEEGGEDEEDGVEEHGDSGGVEVVVEALPVLLWMVNERGSALQRARDRYQRVIKGSWKKREANRCWVL